MRRYLRVVGCLIVLCAGCAPEGPSAFVDGIIAPDKDCLYQSSAQTLIAIGSYDIARGGSSAVDPSGLGPCESPYVIGMRVNSQLRANFDMELGRAEPNVLQVTQAEVTLMSQREEIIGFGDSAMPLPNPFLVNTNLSIPPTDTDEPSLGSAIVEVIPVSYAGWLGDWVGEQILVEVKLYGRTLGDVEVEFSPYRYPVFICNGCMTTCGERPVDTSEDECTELTGSDGRVCFDTTCT